MHFTGRIRDASVHVARQGTLEEAVNADLLLHVIDASSPDTGAQHAAVLSILRQLGMTSTQLARKVGTLLWAEFVTIPAELPARCIL
jgi:hypothetical protein